MYKSTFIIYSFVILVCGHTSLKGQNINPSLRSLDNNKAIAADTSEWIFHRKIKNISLSGKNYLPALSIGGEIREQIRYFNPSNYGDVPPNQSQSDLFLHQRYMMHFDLRLNNTFRFFTQFNSAHTQWKNSISGVDKDQLGVMQAFLDLDFNTAHMSFRAGRQEISFGSERIIGTRDGPNVRQTFDGFKYTLHLNKTNGYLFVIEAVKNNIGVFDNVTNTDNLVFGSYWNIALEKGNTLDLYFFGNNLKEICIEKDTVSEKRNSFGVRFSKSTGSFFHDSEFTLQTGTYGLQSISAFQLTSVIGFRWQNKPLRPSIQLKGTIYSGNRDSVGDQVNFFRPVSARPPINTMVPIGPANIIQVAPEASIAVTRQLGLTFRYYAVWRFSKFDGLYNQEANKLTRMPDKNGIKYGSFVTSGYNLDMVYRINSHINFTGSFGYFPAGEYISNTGKGKDIKSIFLTARYLF